MSAWAQAVWIVNKLTADLNLGQLAERCNALSNDYSELEKQEITIVQQYVQTESGTPRYPKNVTLDGTICLFYDDDDKIDLTGTIWDITSIPSITFSEQYQLTFNTSDSSQFNSLILNNSTQSISYKTTQQTIYPVYSNESWIENRNIITITGGLDTINPELIDWLQNNANQISE